MRKGQIDLELLAVLVILLSIAFAVYISHAVLQKILTNQGSKFDARQTNVFNKFSSGLTYFDKINPIIFALLIMFLIFASILIRTSPIFFPIAIIAVLIMVFYAGQMANMFDVFINQTDIAASKSALPVQTNILRNAPLYIAIIGTLILIATFAKRRDES